NDDRLFLAKSRKGLPVPDHIDHRWIQADSYSFKFVKRPFVGLIVLPGGCEDCELRQRAPESRVPPDSHSRTAKTNSGRALWRIGLTRRKPVSRIGADVVWQRFLSHRLVRLDDRK